MVTADAPRIVVRSKWDTTPLYVERDGETGYYAIYAGLGRDHIRTLHTRHVTALRAIYLGMARTVEVKGRYPDWNDRLEAECDERGIGRFTLDDLMVPTTIPCSAMHRSSLAMKQFPALAHPLGNDPGPIKLTPTGLRVWRMIRQLEEDPTMTTASSGIRRDDDADPPTQPATPQPDLELAEQRSVKVRGLDGRPAYELTSINGDVSIKRTNSGTTKRVAVPLERLERALHLLRGAPGDAR